MNLNLTLLCKVPLRSGGEMAYYAIPARDGESCIRWGGVAPISAWASHPSMRGLLQWASRKAGRQVDVNSDGSILLQEPN